MSLIFESWRKYLVEQKQKYVILIPGGFKPPHRGHVFLINEYANHPDVEKVIVFVGSSPRQSDDKTITIDIGKTMKIFDLYGVFNNPKIELIRATTKVSAKGKQYENPFIDAIEYIDNIDLEKYRNNIFAIGYPTKEQNRGRLFLKATQGSEIATSLPPIVPNADHISATRLRNAIANKNEEIIKESLPDPLMYEEFMNIIFST
jgi:FAD synthase